MNIFRSIFKFGGLGGVTIGLLQIILFFILDGSEDTVIVLYVGIAVLTIGAVTFIITMISSYKNSEYKKSHSLPIITYKTNSAKKTDILKFLKELKFSYDSGIISKIEYDNLRSKYVSKLNNLERDE